MNTNVTKKKKKVGKLPYVMGVPLYGINSAHMCGLKRQQERTSLILISIWTYTQAQKRFSDIGQNGTDECHSLIKPLVVVLLTCQ